MPRNNSKLKNYNFAIFELKFCQANAKQSEGIYLLFGR